MPCWSWLVVVHGKLRMEKKEEKEKIYFTVKKMSNSNTAYIVEAVGDVPEVSAMPTCVHSGPLSAYSRVWGDLFFYALFPSPFPKCCVGSLTYSDCIYTNPLHAFLTLGPNCRRQEEWPGKVTAVTYRALCSFSFSSIPPPNKKDKKSKVRWSLLLCPRSRKVGGKCQRCESIPDPDAPAHANAPRNFVWFTWVV